MSERVTSWGDLLERRSGRRLVGRRRETEQFRLNFLYGVPQSLLFVLQGPPGIGKSALLAEHRAIAEEHGFVAASLRGCDTRLPGQLAIIQAMSGLARQLSAAGVPLTTFDEVYREYTGAFRAIERDPAAPGHAWDFFGGVEDQDPWARRAWDEYLVRTFPLRRSPLIRDPVGTLTERFAQDLNAWATVRRILLCFDDWQTGPRDEAVHESHMGGSAAVGEANLVGRDLGAWLLDLLVRGQLSTNIWFLIAGRAPLCRSWEALASVRTVHELPSLSRRESNALLRGYGLLDRERIEATADLAKGNPLWLTLLASAPELPLSAEPVDPVGGYVNSLEPVLRAAVLKCAVARWLDEGIISVLLGDEAVARVLPWLDRSPLVVKVGKGWWFQPAVRAQLEDLAMRAGSSTWEAAHQTLCAYYRQRNELGGPDPQYLDGVWQRDQLEVLYHHLIIGDESEALNAAMMSFVQGIRQFYPWAGAVAEVWLDAANFCDPQRSVGSWAQKVQAGWQALVGRDWDGILAFSDDLLEADVFLPEIRQAVRAIHQLAAGRLALPPEQVSAVEPSTAEEEEAPSAQESPSSDIGTSVVCEVPPNGEGELHVLVGADAAGDAGGGEVGETSLSADAAGAVNEMAVEHCGYANTLLDQGAYEAAIESYDQALALNADYVAALYNRGLAYAHIGALGGAIADLTRVIELDPRQIQAFRQRGLAYARKGEIDRAILDYDAVLLSDPEASAVYYDRAKAHFKLRSYKRAIEDYTKALESDPNHVEAYLNRGLAYAAQGNYPEAIRDYNQAISLAPRNAISYSHRGQAYVRLERYTEALADYAEALDLAPQNASIHNSRGLLYVRIAAYPEAVEAYQRAMAIQPDWATPYYNAACAAALMKDTERAIIWLARAIALREAYKTMALKDPDFAAIRDHPRYAALVGIQEP